MNLRDFIGDDLTVVEGAEAPTAVPAPMVEARGDAPDPCPWSHDILHPERVEGDADAVRRVLYDVRRLVGTDFERHGWATQPVLVLALVAAGGGNVPDGARDVVRAALIAAGLKLSMNSPAARWVRTVVGAAIDGAHDTWRAGWRGGTFRDFQRHFNGTSAERPLYTRVIQLVLIDEGQVPPFGSAAAWSVARFDTVSGSLFDIASRYISGQPDASALTRYAILAGRDPQEVEDEYKRIKQQREDGDAAASEAMRAYRAEVESQAGEQKMVDHLRALGYHEGSAIPTALITYLRTHPPTAATIKSLGTTYDVRGTGLDLTGHTAAKIVWLLWADGRRPRSMQDDTDSPVKRHRVAYDNNGRVSSVVLGNSAAKFADWLQSQPIDTSTTTLQAPLRPKQPTRSTAPTLRLPDITQDTADAYTNNERHGYVGYARSRTGNLYAAVGKYTERGDEGVMPLPAAGFSASTTLTGKWGSLVARSVVEFSEDSPIDDREAYEHGLIPLAADNGPLFPRMDVWLGAIRAAERFRVDMITNSTIPMWARNVTGSHPAWAQPRKPPLSLLHGESLDNFYVVVCGTVDSTAGIVQDLGGAGGARRVSMVSWEPRKPDPDAPLHAWLDALRIISNLPPPDGATKDHVLIVMDDMHPYATCAVAAKVVEVCGAHAIRAVLGETATVYPDHDKGYLTFGLLTLPPTVRENDENVARAAQVLAIRRFVDGVYFRSVTPRAGENEDQRLKRTFRTAMTAIRDACERAWASNYDDALRVGTACDVLAEWVAGAVDEKAPILSVIYDSDTTGEMHEMVADFLVRALDRPPLTQVDGQGLWLEVIGPTHVGAGVVNRDRPHTIVMRTVAAGGSFAMSRDSGGWRITHTPTGLKVAVYKTRSAGTKWLRKYAAIPATGGVFADTSSVPRDTLRQLQEVFEASKADQAKAVSP